MTCSSTESSWAGRGRHLVNRPLCLNPAVHAHRVRQLSALCPFEARQTWVVNRQFPQSGRGLFVDSRRRRISRVFPPETASGWGAGRIFGS